MMTHPECQRKAQEELDRVIGNHRLPTFEDYADLPYINAILQEILRWFPVLPSSFPRLLAQDHVYKGYLLPKGSTIIPNTWYIHTNTFREYVWSLTISRNVLHDPRIYSKPMEFIPERFVPDENGEVAKDPGASGAFGYGRRYPHFSMSFLRNWTNQMICS